MKHIFIILLLICTPLLAVAQTPQRLTLSVQQSIDIGREKSKSLHSSRMRVDAASAKSAEAGAAMLPSLKAGAAYTRLSDVPAFQAVVPKNSFGPNFPPQDVSFPLSQTILDNYSLKLTLQQPLFTGFRLSAAGNVAENSARAAEQDLRSDDAQLVVSIQRAYWNLFKAREFGRVIDENVDLVKAHLKDVKSLMEQGMVTTNEVLRVEVQLSNAQLLQIDARNNISLAVIALNNAMGTDLSTEIELSSQPDSGAAAERRATPDLVKTAFDRRAELKAMAYRVLAADAGVTMAKSGWYPQIYLTGNYSYARPNPRIVPTQDIFKDTWDVSIGASWDIWNWGSTNDQARQAEAQLAQAKDAESQLRDAVSFQVTQSVLRESQARERIGVAAVAVTQSEENYRITKEKFKLGLVLNSDMLDAEVGLLQSKTNYTQALVDHEIARAELTQALGSLDESANTKE